MAMNREARTSAVDGGATAEYAHLFQALADPTRLAVLQQLASGQHRVRDLVDHMGFAQSTVSRHLSFLSDCRLITMQPEGRSSWYSLADPARLRSLIASAEDLLGAAGTHSQLCAHLRTPQDDPIQEKEND